MKYRINYLHSINDIEAHSWNQLAFNTTPFMQHAFLSALETSQCVCAKTGWQPHHMTIYKETKLIAILPLFIKYHSYGEYVFDWEWARAYQQYGFQYYPKLLTSIPFTPVTGSRLIIAPTESPQIIFQFVVDQIRSLCESEGYSSWHCLFTTNEEDRYFAALNLIKRQDVQFHWVNKGYDTFEQFLAEMSSKKRKNLKRERRRMSEQGIEHHWIKAGEMSASDWSSFYQCYAATYLKRNQSPYLNLPFFLKLADAMPYDLLMVLAKKDNTVIASALFVISDSTSTLYGRYWGCLEEWYCLHFETCYYQGIEYAIAHGLQHFDAGAQGEHKISRGFEPTETVSWHWIAAPQFREAIADFADREAALTSQYQQQCSHALPFKEQP